MNYGDEINVDGRLYVYVRGFSMGCGECSLYNHLNCPGDCNIVCDTGHLERCVPKANITCPHCGHNKYIKDSENEEMFICTKCEQKFIIEV
jgi:hypothetical protein